MSNLIIPNVKKIAVLRSNAVGDFVFSLPALESLRYAYPQAEIVLLGKHWHEEFLKGRTGAVDRVVVVPFMKGIHEDFHGKEDSLEAVDAFFQAMNQEGFDIALQLYGGGRFSNPFIKRIKARLSVGLKTEDAVPLDLWIPYFFYRSEVIRFLEVVSLIGAPVVSLEPRLTITESDLDEAKQLIDGIAQPIAVIHPGASDSRRCWPPEKFAKVGDALAQAGAFVLVTGIKSEEEVAESVIRSMKSRAKNVCGKISLKGLAGLLSMSHIVVSNDTGPLHLAGAVGSATVGLYWIGNFINAGSVTVARHRNHLSWRVHCPECGKDCTKTSCSHKASFIADIPIEEVINSSCELFRQELRLRLNMPV